MVKNCTLRARKASLLGGRATAGSNSDAPGPWPIWAASADLTKRKRANRPGVSTFARFRHQRSRGAPANLELLRHKSPGALTDPSPFATEACERRRQGPSRLGPQRGCISNLESTVELSSSSGYGVNRQSEPIAQPCATSRVLSSTNPRGGLFALRESYNSHAAAHSSPRADPWSPAPRARATTGSAIRVRPRFSHALFYLGDTLRLMVDTSLPGSAAMVAISEPSGATNISKCGPPGTSTVMVPVQSALTV